MTATDRANVQRFLGKVLRRASRKLDVFQARLLKTRTLQERAAQSAQELKTARAAHSALLERQATLQAHHAAELKALSQQREAHEQQLAARDELDRQTAESRKLQDRGYARYAQFYERMRRTARTVDADLDADGKASMPTWAHSKQVEQRLSMFGAEDWFFDAIVTGDQLDTALIKTVRRLLAVGAESRARSVAQVLQSRPEHRSTGDIAMALAVLQVGATETGWELLTRADYSQVQRLAAVEYFRTGALVDPESAQAKLWEALRRRGTVDIAARGWLQIAESYFAVDAEDVSREALQVAAQLGASEPEDTYLAQRIAWLTPWFGRRNAALEPLPQPANGAIAFGVVDYQNPDRRQTSDNLGDHIQTLACLGHLARRSGLRFSGPPDLVQLMDRLRTRVRPERVVDGDDAELNLVRVDRDASNYSSIPDPTWMIAFGWFMHPMFETKYDVPLNPRLRPIFISIHIDAPELLTSEMVEYLRRYAPVGCRDWNTVYLLKAAGVPAFFSGCITSTIDTVFPEPQDAQPSGTLYVDVPPPGQEDTFAQADYDFIPRSLFENISDGIDRVASYRATYSKVVTSRLHCYMPARSVGADVELRPKNAADPRFDGLTFISDEAFERMRVGILDKLERVLTMIAAGGAVEDVYELWRTLCADDVAAADARQRAVGEIEAPRLNVAEVCELIRSEAVTSGPQPGVGAAEIAVSIAARGEQVHELAVCLESIVSHTVRPVHALICAREFSPESIELLLRGFPEVRFTWLPTEHLKQPADGVDAPPEMSDLDQLVLPELLDTVDRVIRLDLGGLCLSDLGDLYDTPLDGHPLAARTSPLTVEQSGFEGLIHASTRLSDKVDLARELIMRTHARQPFDFRTLDTSVMVLDLARMRSDRFCRRFLPYAEHFAMSEDEIINLYAGTDRAELDPAWNTYPDVEVLEHPKLLRWSGTRTPSGPEYVRERASWEQTERHLDRRLGPATGSGS